MDFQTSIDVQKADGASALLVTISCDWYSVNVVIPLSEAAKLEDVWMHDWEGGSLQIGVSGDAPVFWCVGDESGEETVSLLIGQDDETWDIAVMFPISTLNEIVAETRRLRGGS